MPEPPDVTPLHGVTWRPAYERDSVLRFLAEVEAEESRLGEELEAAQSRLDGASRSRLAREAEARAELGALARAAQAEIVRLEEDHRRRVDAIRAAAADEAARILAAARDGTAATSRSPIEAEARP